MEFVHRCHFCGWERETHSPTILEPHCSRCGCLLDSGRREDFRPPQSAELSFGRGLHVPPRTARGLRVGAFGAALFTAAATGFHAGGPWMALGLFGATGLAITPALVRG
jgi:hypothetical protein